MQVCSRCGGENQEGVRFCGFCGAAMGAAGAGRRKLATMVFCDVAESTALGERVDAEVVQSLLSRYFDEMRAALERHGGTVEKFIGDAVVGVFGVPEIHEDDAVRACRAALEMRARLGGLSEEWERRFGTGIAVRIGVNSGEVVAADPETLVTGDAVNVAARLEQAASPGEVLIGEQTHRLVRDAVTVEALEPLAAKGKSGPVVAFRLLEVRGLTRELPRTATPLVGRELELALLERAFEAVVADGRCRLVTVIGEPGVGKSRLIAELVDRVGSRGRAVHGACLSYGEGITYWAMGEIVRQLAGIRDQHTPEQAQALIAALVEQGQDAEAIAARVGQLLGVAEGASTAAETAWALRGVLAAQAANWPLLVIVDDIHWAEPLLLEALAALPERIVTAPILVVCLARPELLEHHPEWEATIRLEPLTEADANALVNGLLGDASGETRERLVHACAGNPLFAEELVAWTREADVDVAALPDSLQALLGARLDQLEPKARAVLERGAIEGEVFHRGAVIELTAAEARPVVPAQLVALTGKDLVRPAAASFVDEAGFRFKHVLVRDAAYQATAKKVRAVLHEQYANWLARVAGERVTEYEEILGYHLEQSFRYRLELGAADATTDALAARAAEHLTSAGLRARSRDDRMGALALLTRAGELQPSRRLALLPVIGDILRQQGDYSRCAELLDEAIATAREQGEEAIETVAALLRAIVALQTGKVTFAQMAAAADQAVVVLERVGDDAQLALALETAARQTMWFGRAAEATILAERALQHALRAGDDHRARHCVRAICGTLLWGPAPVSEALEYLKRLSVERRTLLAPENAPSIAAATIGAYSGRFAEARQALTEARLRARELGDDHRASAHLPQLLGRVELLSGDPAEAELVLRQVYDRLGEMGEKNWRASTATTLAEALMRRGCDEDASEMLAVADDLAQRDDYDAQVRMRAVRAQILSRRGEHAQAHELAREAVDMVGQTDDIVLHGDALLALADVLRRSGATEEANAALRQALELFERKENIVQAKQTRELLSELETSSPLSRNSRAG